MTMERDLLVAYADGELAPQDCRRVEAWIEQDPEAAELLEALRAQRGLLREAFAEDLAEPLPAQTLALFAGKPRAQEAPSWWRAGVAAGIAAAVCGGLAALAVAELRTDQLLARYEAERALDREQLASMVQSALENSPSGETLRWEGESGSPGGTVLPLRTFRNQEGDWCREYRAEAVIGIERLQRRAIACRTAEGAWITRAGRDEETSQEAQAPAI